MDSVRPQPSKPHVPTRTWAVFTMLAIVSAGPFAQEVTSDGVPLFDGRSLDGWTPVDVDEGEWKAVDGLLVNAGQGHGWLSTNAVYQDFEISLEYRLQPGGNSGIFLRAPREGLPWLTGIEIQILDDDAEIYRELRPAQYCGSVYGVVPARRGHTKPPGEWNSLRITAQGSLIVVRLNGELVVDADLAQHQGAVTDHPGLRNREGYIGLQSHNEPVEFRDIRIRELR